MAITIASNLTPSALSALDYNIAQAPALGGEKEVWLTALPMTFLGVALMTGTGTVSYERINNQMSKTLTGTVSSSTTTITGTNTLFTTEVAVGDLLKIDSAYFQVASIASDTELVVDTAPSPAASADTVTCYPAWPILAVVLNELKADAAAVPSFVGLTKSGGFAPVPYSSNQSYNFAASRAVELTGTQTGPVITASVPAITNAKRGCRIGFVQVPKLADYIHVGCTTSKDITIPVRQSKYVSRGLETTWYNKTGKTAEGRLKVTARDYGTDDGLARFFGVKCVAMIVTTKEDQIITDRQFCLNYVPNATETNPDADGESAFECDGTFQHLLTLPAP